MSEIKAITLYQPWASAIALGFKKFETRSWSTGYRGLILIHAGKKIDWVLRQALLIRVRALAPDRAEALAEHSRTLGSIVAVAYLDACWPTDRIDDYGGVSGLEWCCGDFSPGRFAWMLEDVIRLAEPISCRGAQGLWNPSCEVVMQLPSGALSAALGGKVEP